MSAIGELRKTFVVAGWLLVMSCDHAGPEEVVRSHIQGEVLRRGWESRPDETLYRVPYHTGADTSRVLLGTVYHWGLYFPPELSHGWLSAIAVERAGRVSLLRDLDDWTRLAGSFRASTETEALQACTEIVRYAGARSDPFNLPVIVPPLPPDARVLWWESLDSIITELDSPSVTGDASGWTVHLWASEMARTVQYSCRLPAEGSGDLPRLVVLDTLSEGLFADEH